MGRRVGLGARFRAVALLALVALAVLVTGCGREEGQEIRRWTFDSADGARDVEMPVHLDLPKRLVRYRLTADVAIAPSLRGASLDLAIPSFSGPVSLRAG